LIETTAENYEVNQYSNTTRHSDIRGNTFLKIKPSAASLPPARQIDVHLKSGPQHQPQQRDEGDR
jgi:hypothetical protein